RSVDELVGRLNGRFATLGHQPIHYISRTLTRERLIALYRAASVAMVTPLRDGMNLVAKEYVASRVDDDGVLVLSEFAGAAEELQEALMVNAYDVDAMAAAMRTAMAMSAGERRRRMRALSARVTTYDVQRWADDFVRALSSDRVADRRHTSDVVLAETLSAIRGAGSVAVLLDYDGTLVPLADSPEAAQPDGDLLSLIDALA